jgi:coenzyme F420 hydrogenase subunit beta
MRTTDYGQGRQEGTRRRAPGPRKSRVAPLRPKVSRVGQPAAAGQIADDQAETASPRASRPKRPTIQRVVKRSLCTGCGTCVGICPEEALSMVVDRKRGRYIPRIDKRQCNRCGLCLDACPGHAVDFHGLSKELMGDIPENVMLGKYLASYIGHATDKDVRYRAASGGFALERGFIDGALVTRMHPSKPLEPRPFIARTREEILSTVGSKYCPVPAGAALDKILHSEGRFAVVGLPCHIQGIRKAEQHIPALRERIRYHISLTCSLDYSFRGTQALLGMRGIAPRSVEALAYRGRGWPGSMMIRQVDGSKTTIPLQEYYKELGPFSLRRCTLCSDMFGELSDLSCGDAWIPEVMKTDKLGSSFALTRTPAGEELLEAAAADEYVQLSDLDVGELAAGQRHAIFKKRKLGARMALFRWMGKSVPAYQQKLLKPIAGDKRDMIKFYMARYALSGSHAILRRFLHATGLLKRNSREETGSA